MRVLLSIVCASAFIAVPPREVDGGQLMAGVAKVDITNREAGPVNDPLYAKALVVSDNKSTIVIVSVDAVAIGEIGHISNEFLSNVRSRIEQELDIDPAHIFVNASHCHGVVCTDPAERTIKAIEQAVASMQPVKVGAIKGREDSISENRRIHLKDGSTTDSRRAYPLPADDEIDDVGSIDPDIGILLLQRMDGTPLAVAFNFACHPIQGVPSLGNTADLSGLAATAIEETLGHDCIALFIQGCAGDINPVGYKDVDNPPDAQSLANQLALSTLKAIASASPSAEASLGVHCEKLSLPAANFTQRIYDLDAKREALLNSLSGTSINLKTFVPLIVKYNYSSEFPSYYSHRYLHERKNGRNYLLNQDATNRKDLERYMSNIHTMEELTRVQENLRLLKEHQRQCIDRGSRYIEVEIGALRIGEFRLVTFPGELTSQIGLDIKAAVGDDTTFVAGYTNGYIYYAPTDEQLRNPGFAQEDCDTLLAPGWQALFEAKAIELLRGL